ncbi:hypothetical protein BFJ68_g16092 [Fusarium oxysporum]|uniref:Xylanolytic transcriptional activator regulatory domain-containing protein n=1 Tax=Fusarium oxysporum TaxID=5507 RepID=A0A420PH49_FUSOX|nr:hypothetical protein BFJ68_g16092 [Fusarium oxysporum]
MSSPESAVRNRLASDSPTSTHTANATRPKATISSETDAMTGVGKDCSGSTEFFGDSSAVSFMTQINSAIDARLGQTQTSSTSDIIDEVQTSYGKKVTSSQFQDWIDPLTFRFPPRNFCDDLIQDYYDLVWVILPTHDWTSFKQDYDAIWIGSLTTTTTRPLHCMINMALALGSQFSKAVPPGERKRMGQTFWERALALYDPRLQQGASLEGIQCFLMMGLFLQSTHQSHQCWMIVGSAVRMAQSLGLHLCRTTAQNEDIRHVEMMRKVWHGCVFMDRVMSMTFGRPSMIANWLYDSVPLPTMIDEDLLGKQCLPYTSRPDGATPTIAFFIKSVELYSIVNDSLLELYMRQPQKESEEAEHVLSVLQFDDRLVRWFQSVPDGLCYSSGSNENSVLRRQCIVLRARYLHARIVVLRPILTESCLKQVRADHHSGSAPTDQRLSHSLTDQCSIICFDSAHKIINMIHANLDLETVTGPVPAWWFSVLFVYTAATVLLAERFRQLNSTFSTTEPWQAKPAWDQAIQLLRAYAKVGDSAKRCVAALEILLAKIQGYHHISEHGEAHDDRALTGNAFIEQQNDAPLVAFDDITGQIDLDGMDFDIDDMLWLNTSAAEFLV